MTIRFGKRCGWCWIKSLGTERGLIYGMGHAVYTLSDPRAIMLRDNAEKLAKIKGMEDEFQLLKKIEQLTPEVFAEKKDLLQEYLCKC